MVTRFQGQSLEIKSCNCDSVHRISGVPKQILHMLYLLLATKSSHYTRHFLSINPKILSSSSLLPTAFHVHSTTWKVYCGCTICDKWHMESQPLLFSIYFDIIIVYSIPIGKNLHLYVLDGYLPLIISQVVHHVT